MSETGENMPENQPTPWEAVNALIDANQEFVTRTEFGTEQLLLSANNPERPGYWYAVTLRRYADDSPGSAEAMRRECGLMCNPDNGLLAIEIMSLNDRDGVGLQVSEHGAERHTSTGGSLRVDKSPRQIIEIAERATPIRLAA